MILETHSSNTTPEANQISKEVNSYPRSFAELLQYLMKKYSEKSEAFAYKTFSSERTMTRLRSNDYRPTLADIKMICVAMKPSLIDGLQLIRTAGYDPASSDCEMIDIMLCFDLGCK